MRRCACLPWSRCWGSSGEGLNLGPDVVVGEMADLAFFAVSGTQLALGAGLGD